MAVIVRQAWPVHDAATWVSGQQFEPEETDLPCVEFYHLLGFGKQQIYKGASQYRNHLRCKPVLTFAEHNEWVEVWEQRHPHYVRWSEGIGTQMHRDGFVANPYGRRGSFYSKPRSKTDATRVCQEGVRFVLLSTAVDCMKDAIVQASVAPIGISFGQIKLRSQEDADRLLAIETPVRWDTPQ